MLTKNKTFILFFLLNTLFDFLLLLKSSAFLITSLSSERFILPSISYYFLLRFFLAHVLVICCFSLSQYLISASILTVCKISKPNTFAVCTLVWISTTFTVLLLNQLNYPISAYTVVLNTFISPVAAKLILAILLFTFVLFLSIYLYKISKTLFIALGSLLFITYTTTLSLPATDTPTPPSKPNLIIIGIDSLRFNELNHAPHLKTFLEKAVVFDNTLTPLARTYCSWLSILTGLYPTHSGALFNLIDPKNIKAEKSLAHRFKQLGFHTIYATDSTRFSQIDGSLGFDETVSPPSGVNEFIQSAINDIPLMNLIVNTWGGKYLFPYNYINRDDVIHYDGSRFNHTLFQALKARPKNKPLLLIVHYTLPHWPYLHRYSKQEDLNIAKDEKRIFSLYPKVLSETDGLFKELINKLAYFHLLDKANMVVLSDHGETANEYNSRITQKEHYHAGKHHRFIDLIARQHMPINQSAGHGTDVLSLNQHKSLLAFLHYPRQYTNKHIRSMASLLDIKPTLYELYKLNSEKNDGKSLLPLIIGRKDTLKERDVYLETGFNPNLSLYNKGRLKNIVTIGKQYYRVSEINDHLLLKNDVLKKLIKDKEYAIIQGNWMLALYPTSEAFQPVVINLQTMNWTDDLTSPFAKKAPLNSLLKKITRFYPITHKLIQIE